MIVPVSDGTLNVVCVSKQDPDDAGQRARQRRDDDERIEPGLKIDDDQQVDQNDGDGHSRAQSRERRRHRGDLPAAHQLRAARKLVLEIRQNLLNVRVHAAQVAPFDRRIDVQSCGWIVVVGDQRRLDVHAQRSQVAQNLRRLGLRGGDRNIFQRLHGVDLVLRHLHGDVVFVCRWPDSPRTME